VDEKKPHEEGLAGLEWRYWWAFPCGSSGEPIGSYTALNVLHHCFWELLHWELGCVLSKFNKARSLHRVHAAMRQSYFPVK